MVEKVKYIIKRSIDVIGIREFIKAYVLLGVFLLFALMVGGFEGMDNGIGFTIYLIIAIITFPFSISLFNLVANFFLGSTMIFGGGFFWLIFFVIKYAILFFFAPIFAFIFILLVTLTDSVEKWIVKYENKNKNN